MSNRATALFVSITLLLTGIGVPSTAPTSQPSTFPASQPNVTPLDNEPEDLAKLVLKTVSKAEAYGRKAIPPSVNQIRANELMAERDEKVRTIFQTLLGMQVKTTVTFGRYLAEGKSGQVDVPDSFSSNLAPQLSRGQLIEISRMDNPQAQAYMKQMAAFRVPIHLVTYRTTSAEAKKMTVGKTSLVQGYIADIQFTECDLRGLTHDPSNYAHADRTTVTYAVEVLVISR